MFRLVHPSRPPSDKARAHLSKHKHIHNHDHNHDWIHPSLLGIEILLGIMDKDRTRIVVEAEHQLNKGDNAADNGQNSGDTQHSNGGNSLVIPWIGGPGT